MPLFALPLTSSSMTRFSKSKTSRVKFTSLPVRKRKRSHSSPQSSDDDEDFSTDEQSGVAASTNPFSLTPAEIAQYRLAGLELNEKLPDVKAFPHRGLPRTAGSHDTSAKGKASRRRSRLDDGDDEEDTWLELKEEEEDKDAVERPSRGPWLRNQHLSVLTTILHRCLQEGDIKRASRAWAMLLRVQISGKEIDVRSNGYWEIGAALLMRSLDKKKKYSYDDAESDAEDFAEQVEDEGRESRWGTKEGLEKAKSFSVVMPLQSISGLRWWAVSYTGSSTNMKMAYEGSKSKKQ
ncbi:hypothetical protein LZ554_002063 [Drepanopeziza brunnea f. sp. 'monogermtubi']|nr:hypothetical protein LZ554_002063 [Drepanopeziza brunnea f. sp. 'monogermtubi']